MSSRSDGYREINDQIRATTKFSTDKGKDENQNLFTIEHSFVRVDRFCLRERGKQFDGNYRQQFKYSDDGKCQSTGGE
jgi:hypothetical protein